MKIEFVNFLPDLTKINYVYPLLGIPIVAALTPEDVEIVMSYLQKGEEIVVKDVDVIAMSVFTHHAPYVYEISQKYRAAGKKVILGGIHPSILPDEALQFCDCVVIGEAELIWSTVIKDLKNDNLQRIYKSDQFISLDIIPKSRVDLLDKDKYITRAVLHASRGCPHNCSFCSVTQFFGNTYRFRPIPHIIDEINSFLDKGISRNRYVIFNDDNIGCSKKYSRELFNELKNLKITWASQANFYIADDPEFLKLAADSGCISLFIGIESLNPANLQDINKSMNHISKYEDAIKKIHDNGIVIIGSFIFGLDHDDEGIIDTTMEFIEKTDIDIPTFSVLTPFPGTQLHQELEEQGRIIVKDWSKYDLEHVVYQPKLISPEKLQEKLDYAYISTALRRLRGGKRLTKTRSRFEEK